MDHADVRAQIAVDIWPRLLHVPRRGAAPDEETCAEIERVTRALGAAPRPAGSCPGPLIQRSMTAAELRAIAWNEDAAWIDSRLELREMSTAWFGTVLVGSAHSGGWTGSGVTVGVVELWSLDSTAGLSGIVGVRFPGGDTNPHARLVTSLVRNSGSPGGIAPGANIVLSSCVVGGICQPGMEEWAVANGAQVLNGSYGAYSPPSASVHPTDALSDWIVLQFPYPPYARSAGNIDPLVPNTFYVGNRQFNGVITGGADDHGTTSRTDDTWFGSWMNPGSPHGDRELPELVAPGANVDTVATGGPVSGTSISSPIVAGAAALIVQRNPFNLSAGNWPEALKAILMASADCNIDGPILDLGDAVDDRDGVGQLNVENAVSLANPANANFGTTATTAGFRYGLMSQSAFVGGTSWPESPRVRAGRAGG